MKDEGVGMRLRAFREGLSLSQRGFAISMGLNPGQVRSVEVGVKAPSWALLEQLHACYGMSIDWLLVGEGAALYSDRAGLNDVQRQGEQAPLQSELELGALAEVIRESPHLMELVNVPRAAPGMSKSEASTRARVDQVLASGDKTKVTVLETILEGLTAPSQPQRHEAESA